MDAAAFGRKIREAFAPCSLGAWPTPLQAAPGLAEAAGLAALWLKREDVAGGNKVRGLEFLLAGARPDTVFVTVGGTASTHCRATAIHARALGFRTAVALFPQPETAVGHAVGMATAEHADLVMRAGSRTAFPFALLRAWRGARRIGRPRWVPGGGATPRAVIGHLLATLELATQLDEAPEVIVLPLGTGGTAAGIALGVHWLGWPTRVVGVRVAPHVIANRWRARRLARQAAALLGLPAPTLRLEVRDGLGAGYGYPSPAGGLAERLAAAHGVRLDPTYGAKAFAVLRQEGEGLRGARAVFWHTFTWPGQDPLR